MNVLARPSAFLRRRPAVRVVLVASVTYLAFALASPVMLPQYNRALTVAYSALAPVLEHPRLTDSLEWVDGQGAEPQRHVSSKAVRGGGFTFKVAYLYGITLGLFLALVVATPAVSWRSRGLIASLGVPPLVLLHFVALWTTVRETFAHVPLLDETLRPGTWAIDINAAFRAVLMSEVGMSIPFVLWGALALWAHGRERARADGGPAPESPS